MNENDLTDVQCSTAAAGENKRQMQENNVNDFATGRLKRET